MLKERYALLENGAINSKQEKLPWSDFQINSKGLKLCHPIKRICCLSLVKSNIPENSQTTLCDPFILLWF